MIKPASDSRTICENSSIQIASNPDYVKGMIRNQIGQFLFNKTKRRPMVLPVIIEI